MLTPLSENGVFDGVEMPRFVEIEALMNLDASIVTVAI